MGWGFRVPLVMFLALSFGLPRAAALDWAPVTDVEQNMKSNPLDPGAGAVVLFKRGKIDVLETHSLFWTTSIETYARIKILTDAGREAANVSVEYPMYMRFSKIEGRTILPSGQVIPLDSSQVFRGRAYESGKHFAVTKVSITFPAVEPGAIIEYQMREDVDWFFPPPWIFDTDELATLQSSLRVVIGPRLSMSQFPLETTTSKISISRSTTTIGDQIDFAVENLRPIRREPFGVPFRDQATMIMFTPSEMAFGDQLYPIITKWDDVATEISKQLSNMTKNEREVNRRTKELVGKLPEGRSRAEAIYNYLQRNVTSSNLVGIYLGRSVDEIMTSKRGDPDEINAVFVTMLKEAKLDADMVLVAGQNWQTLVSRFPNLSQFSRLITRVNLKEGPVFADPAAAAAPFGELPWFETGVLGLAVKGSKIQEAKIPAGAPEDNLSNIKVAFEVAHDWKAEGDAEVDLTGAEAINFRGDLLEEPPDKVERLLTDFFTFGKADAAVTNIVHPDFRDSSKPVVLKAHLQQKFVDESGPGELLLNPWLHDQYSSPIFKGAERH